ncbi:MAG: hydroxymethylglutaryl-CoA lyase [Leptospirales bacterium]|nr:hydroxymethylglutaryl-CoA lyase [Leptospirales bacterium]
MNRVRVYEVGPRDGLQNESQIVSTEAKVTFIEKLTAAGLDRIEAVSFVKPGAIPQMADASEVYRRIKNGGAVYAGLVPNAKGMETALAAGIQEVAVFTAASESFTQKNINCTIDESFERFKDVIRLARENSIPVRGYVSTVVQCPYEGPVSPQKVSEVSSRLLEAGVYEISLGDTIGAAVPNDISRLLDVVLKNVSAEKLAGHFHDTRGTALANVFRSLDYGIRTFDSSAGGLGGCPYAPGASGNLATEDLLYSLHKSGYETGVNLEKIADASVFMRETLSRVPASRVFAALKR